MNRHFLVHYPLYAQPQDAIETLRSLHDNQLNNTCFRRTHAQRQTKVRPWPDPLWRLLTAKLLRLSTAETKAPQCHRNLKLWSLGRNSWSSASVELPRGVTMDSVGSVSGSGVVRIPCLDCRRQDGISTLHDSHHTGRVITVMATRWDPSTRVSRSRAETGIGQSAVISTRGPSRWGRFISHVPSCSWSCFPNSLRTLSVRLQRMREGVVVKIAT